MDGEGSMVLSFVGGGLVALGVPDGPGAPTGSPEAAGHLLTSLWLSLVLRVVSAVGLLRSSFQ